MDQVQEKIEIPQVTYQGDDKKLKERVSKFKAGTLRIVIFTIVGLFMGHYSNTYVTDPFFPTKLVTAIPYKITEAIYSSILRADTLVTREYSGYTLEWQYFPYSAIANLLAEPFTTMLIGGAIYGSFAYFTGDKRVFTLQRFLKFAGGWCALILLVTGLAFGMNANAKADNEKFGEVDHFFFYSESGGTAVAGGGSELSDSVRQYFYNGLAPVDLVRDYKGELPLGIYYDDGLRYGLYQINYEMQYVVTEEGRIYHISKEFAQLVEDYALKGLRPGMEVQEVAE